MDDYQIIPIGNEFKLNVLTHKPFVIPKELEGIIDELWEKACLGSNGRMFNGQIFSAVQIEKDSISGVFIDYKLFAAQLQEPKLASILPIMPVAVSGMTTSGDFILIGKRSPFVTQFKGLWELVPSGGIDPDSVVGSGVDLKSFILKELGEESGFLLTDVESVDPLILIKSQIPPHIELCVAIHLKQEAAMQPVPNTAWEYDACQWVSIPELAKTMKTNRDEFVPVSILLFENRL